MPDILDIKDVPPSPGTSLEPTEVYNPLSEDFVWSFQGKPYTIPAQTKKTFPEIIARYLAKHLGRKIVYGNFEGEIQAEIAKLRKQGDYNPMATNVTKAVPGTRTEKMIEWLLNPAGVSPEGEKEPVTATKLEETLTDKEREVLEKYRKKVEAAAKARAAKK